MPGLLPPLHTDVVSGPPLDELVLHLDFSNGANLFQVADNPPTTSVGENDVIGEIIPEISSPDSVLLKLADNQRPVLRTSQSLLKLQTAEFDGSNDQLEAWTPTISAAIDSIGTTPGTNCYVSNAEYSFAVILYPGTISGADHRVLGDANSFFLLRLVNDSGVRKAQFLSWDTGYTTVEVALPTPLNKAMILIGRHDGTAIHLSVNGGTEDSAACGPTNASASAFRISHDGAPGQFQLGELMLYNKSISPSEKSTLVDYFDDKWRDSDEEDLLPPALANLVQWAKTPAFGAVVGSPLANWRDSSGNGFDFNSGTGPDPDYITSTLIGGYPTLDFDASNTENLSNGNSHGGAGFSEATFVIIGKRDVDPAADLATSGSWYINFFQSGGNSHHPFSDGAVYDATLTDTRKNVGDLTDSWANNFFYIVRSKSAQWDAHMNGVEVANTTSNTFQGGNSTTIGASFINLGSEYFWDGKFVEVLLYNKYLDDTEKGELIAYILDKYGSVFG